MYTVTRQQQWPDGDLVVEISARGIDYTNPDALTAKYSGEFTEYQDAREAVNVAIEIAETWQSDILAAGRIEAVSLGFGATGGYTMPFDTLPLTPAVKRYLRNVARVRYNAADKCPKCGAIMPEDLDKRFHLIDTIDDDEYCSEACAERAQAEQEMESLRAFCEGAGKDIRYVRERYLAAGPNWVDAVEWNFAQVAASAIAVGLAVFSVYIGAASAWALVATL